MLHRYNAFSFNENLEKTTYVPSSLKFQSWVTVNLFLIQNKKKSMISLEFHSM